MNDDDWLEVETPEDWLSTEATSLPAVVEKPSIATMPALPDSASGKLKLLDECWARLKPKQRIYIETWRDCRWNERGAVRALENTPDKVSKRAVRYWFELNDDYRFVVQVLREDAAAQTLDKSKLLLRQEDIVEQLMTPTPILHQGVATGYFENRAPQASKANEVLMKAAGLLKNDEGTTRHVVRFVNLAGPEVQTAIEVATEIT